MLPQLVGAGVRAAAGRTALTVDVAFRESQRIARVDSSRSWEEAQVVVGVGEAAGGVLVGGAATPPWMTL